jgi:FkbM family methyltransferase
MQNAAPAFCFADHLPREWAVNLLVEGCPSDLWQERLAEALDALNATFVNVGANKGYKIPPFLSVHDAALLAVNPKAWHVAILDFAKRKSSGQLKWISCGGGCRDCDEPPVKPHQRERRPTVHALELVPHNAELIEALANATGVGHRVRVHNLAVSNISGVTPMMTTTGALRYGSEIESICLHKNTSRCRMGSLGWQRAEPIFVEQTTVDRFFAHEGLRHTSHVSIDVEGWDPLVLEGMARVLRERRSDTIEFEYIARGYWAHPLRRSRLRPRQDGVVPKRERRKLRDVLTTLGSLGWECYFQVGAALLTQPLQLQPQP